MKLQGRVALITGAASGIGKAAAQLMAQEGARVGLLDVHSERLEGAAREIKTAGGQAMTLMANVSQPHQMESAVQHLIETWRQLDIVFANAGINGVWAPIDELEPEDWDRTRDINLTGVFLTCKYTVPHLRLRGGGAIIMTASVQGTRQFTVPGSTAYACSKAAVVAMAKKLALELARDRIRVNVICPGATATHLGETTVMRHIEKIRLPVEYPEGTVLLTGGKPATPEQIAPLVLFLASDDAGLISGTEVWIDGASSLFT